jgi:peptide chain release factor 1
MEYNKRLFSTLESIVKKYDELNNELENSSVSHQRIAEINKELKKTKEIKEAFLPFRMIINDGLMAEKILETEKDKEMLEFARTELSEAKLKIKDYEDKLQILLLPKDPHNNRNIIVEMRPAAGGDESSIFVGDLFETYSKFCENQN